MSVNFIAGFSELLDSKQPAVVDLTDIGSSHVVRLASIPSQIDDEEDAVADKDVVPVKELTVNDDSLSTGNPVPLPRKRKGVSSQIVIPASNTAVAISITVPNAPNIININKAAKIK